MATQILSFGSIPKLHDNNELTTSPLGELSNKTRTYVKDPNIFNIVGASTTIICFYSNQDGNFFKVPTEIYSKQIEISDWLLIQANNNNLTSSRVNCLQQLKATFTSDVIIDDVGEMVTNSVIFLPSFISGKHIVGADQYVFKIWYSNDHLDYEYPYRDIEVVHPIPLEDIDYLADNNYIDVAAMIATQTPDVIEKRVAEKTNNYKYPYTERYVQPFQIHDRINIPSTVMGYWRIPVWGNTYDIDDDTYDKIAKEILDNSEYGEDVWEEVIPDLFNPREFFCVPYWNRTGLVNKTDATSTYSPISDFETDKTIPAKILGDKFEDSHLIKSLQIIPFIYQSLAVAFIAKKTNYGGLIKIKELFPGYQLIDSLDTQFEKMGETTTEFILKFSELLAAAEEMTPYSIPPSGINRVTKQDVLYATKRIQGVKFHVVTRYQFVKAGVITE